MIQAKDLMVGNIIDYNGEHLPVLAIDSEKTFEELKGTVTIPHVVAGVTIGSIGRWCEHLQGIPLTPELLVDELKWQHNYKGQSCEFCSYKLTDKLYLDFIVETKEISLNSADCGVVKNFGILPLHQLQNLIHSLCNTEII